MNFIPRKYIIVAIFCLTVLVFMARLFYLQVIDQTFKASSENNVFKYITEYPVRGYIYDRKGELLVYNQPVYDLMVIPKQVTPFDTVQFCELIHLEKANLIAGLKKAKAYSRYKESIIEKQISAETYATLQEKMYKFPGFYLQNRTVRKYPEKSAAHILGYISEVDEKIIEKDNYYKTGDYIGYSGIESTYEKELRGKRGMKIVLVDVHNKVKASYDGGKYDSLAVSGKPLTMTIDAQLQQYGELLMQNKKGSIVALDPATGEILTLVTCPAYDPNLLVGRVRTENYSMLLKDTLKPLFNRALMASYPPGSTFKLINALIGQQEGVLKPSTSFSCSRGFHSGSLTVGCHPHPSPVDLNYSIITSCNSFYCNAFLRILNTQSTTRAAYNIWRDHVMSFGLGNKTNIDLPNELKGLVASGDYYDRYYGKDKWKPLTVISLAIGQGELGVTPIQMANMTATIANRGFYYTPHLVKEINHVPISDERYTTKHETKIERKYFDFVIEAMEEVVQRGTGYGARLDSIIVCGKTGTAENPHGKDHSIFIAFAPKDNPKIAIAVYIENAGFGSTWAVPVASLMIEKYLTGEIKRPLVEKRILEANLILTANEKEDEKEISRDQ